MNITFSKPDFLVVGPFKTGTTWLYTQLCKVNGLAMPPYKEISFFYHADFKRRVAEKVARMVNGTLHPGMPPIKVDEDMKKEMWSGYYDTIRKNYALATKGGNSMWQGFYKLIPNNLDKFSIFLYSRLFDQSQQKIAGDVSPYYFQLSDEAIGRVKAALPDLKVIFILRDPVEREWSNIRMNYYSGGGGNSFLAEKYFSEDRVDSDYKRAIETWEKHLGRGRILYLFFDDLTENPESFMDRFLKFVMPVKPVFRVGTEKIAVGIEKEIEPIIRNQLLINNLPQYEFLADKFGINSHPFQWKEKALAELKAFY